MMLRRLVLSFVVLPSVVLLSACSQPQAPAAVLRDAWSPAAPPGANVIAVYGDIETTHDDVLLGISTPLAASAELHSSREENGMMQMRPVERLELAAGRVVSLAPGGLHLMLVGIREPLASGAQIPLTLRFEHAGEIAATALVRAPQ